MEISLLCILVLSLVSPRWAIQQYMYDESQDPWEAKSSYLPMKEDGVTINDRYMPTLSNGHIGVTVYDGALYLNGLYEGTGGDSHRAQVPATSMFRINLTDPYDDVINDIERTATRKYYLNVKEGYFMETIDCEFAFIEHRIYVHQKYVRLLVSDIYAVRKDGTPGGVLYLQYPASDTDDIEFGQKQNHYSNWKIAGNTKSAENDAAVQNVNVYWTTRVEQIPFRGNSPELNETFLMAVDKEDSRARTEFDLAIGIIEQTGGNGHYQLFEEHIDAWKNTWDQGRVEVEGDLTVAKVTNFAQYYLYSDMPALDPYLPPLESELFYGISRSSLAKGGLGKDYQGHVFWDNEVYIQPALLFFFPDNVKKMMRYRSSLAQRAAEHAASMGAQGLRYPWESAFSGNDVTPDTCMECRDNQLHVSAAISWLIRQFYSVTRDNDYITNPDYSGCDMARELARFYDSIAEFNTSTGRYDIRDVMGPDDWRPKVDNNAYTNAASSLAIHWARYFACLCGREEEEEVPDEWIHTALQLAMPFDGQRRRHYQYEGFDKDIEVNQTKIKQADAILLGYPLNWNISVSNHDILRNDLEYYDYYQWDRSPAMTWSFIVIGWKWINEKSKMQSYFVKSYQDYMISPFRIWTEYKEESWADQEEGAVNYLPGMGGYMQSLIYGFGGVRIRPESLEFHDPYPPPNCDRMTFHKFKYLGATMTIVIESSGTVTIKMDSVGQYPLVLHKNDTHEEINLDEGSETLIDNAEAGFFIFAWNSDSGSAACEHPKDFIVYQTITTPSEATTGPLTPSQSYRHRPTSCTYSSNLPSTNPTNQPTGSPGSTTPVNYAKYPMDWIQVPSGGLLGQEESVSASATAIVCLPLMIMSVLLTFPTPGQ